jgi:hypothetical protein
MKRAIFFISAIIIISSFSSQLLALPEGAVASFLERSDRYGSYS